MCPVNTKGTDPVRLKLVDTQWNRVFVFMLWCCRPFSIRKHHQVCVLTCLEPLEWGRFWFNEQVTPSVNRTAEQEFNKQQLPKPKEQSTWAPLVQNIAPGSVVKELHMLKVFEPGMTSNSLVSTITVWPGLTFSIWVPMSHQRGKMLSLEQGPGNASLPFPDSYIFLVRICNWETIPLIKEFTWWWMKERMRRGVWFMSIPCQLCQQSSSINFSPRLVKATEGLFLLWV